MKYQNPAATVDLLVEDSKKRLLTIKRKHHPYKGYWALPGGYLNYKQETLEQAAVRELREETGLIVRTEDLELLGNYSDPERDPRGHVISHAYIVKKYSGQAKAGDDASDVFWIPIKSMNKWFKLAFDHRKIISDYKKYKNKNE